MLQKTVIKLNTNPQGFGSEPDELDSEMFESGSPVQHSHSDYEDDDIGLYVGVWDTNDMREVSGPYAMDEYMWLIEGEVNIKNCTTGELENVKAGQAFVIPKGFNCQWQQTGYLKKFYVISEHPNESLPDKPSVEGIVKPHRNKPSTLFENTELFDFNGQVPVQRNDIDYQNNSGSFAAGTFDSEPFVTKARASSVNLFVNLLEGFVTVNDTNGSNVFIAGDAFFIPKGTQCSWHSTVYIKANYAVVK